MTPLSLGIFASANLSAAATSFESIATVTVGSGGASSVEFTSIAADWTHLQVRFIAKWSTGTTGEGALRMSINGSILDNSHYLLGDGSSAGAGAPGQFISSVPLNGQNGWCGGVLDILDYKNTNKNKTVRCLSGYDNNGTGTSLILLYSGLEATLSAITSLKFDSATLNFAQYSHFALYGLRSA